MENKFIASILTLPAILHYLCKIKCVFYCNLMPSCLTSTKYKTLTVVFSIFTFCDITSQIFVVES